MLRLGNKGQAGGVGLVAGATLMVVGVVFLLIGIFISQEINTQINASLGAGGASGSTLYATANATPGMAAAWNTYGAAQSGFTLGGIALIVIGAVVILSLLRSAF